MQSFVSLAVWASVAAMVTAGVACGLRRWQLAARLARAVVLASPILIIAFVVAFVVIPPSRQAIDPSMKATTLSQGISEVMNCSVLVLAAALPAWGMWSFARSRVNRKAAG